MARVSILILGCGSDGAAVSFLRCVHRCGDIRGVLIMSGYSSSSSFVRLQGCSSSGVRIIGASHGNNCKCNGGFKVECLRGGKYSSCILLTGPSAFVRRGILAGVRTFLTSGPTCTVITPFVYGLGRRGRIGATFGISSLFGLVVSVYTFAAGMAKNFCCERVLRGGDRILSIRTLSKSLFVVGLGRVLSTKVFSRGVFLFYRRVILKGGLFRRGVGVTLLPRVAFVRRRSISVSGDCDDVQDEGGLLRRDQRCILQGCCRTGSVVIFLSQVLSGVGVVR